MIASFEEFYIDVIQEKDAWELCDLMVANVERFKRYFPSTLAQNLTLSLAKEFTLKKTNEFTKKLEFLFTVKQEDRIIGLVYIKELDWNKKQGEFAYCIGSSHEGKGLTSIAVKVLSSFAFTKLGLETLQIIVHKDNKPSVMVAKNSGFNWQRTLLNEYTPPNESPLDMELYELYKN